MPSPSIAVIGTGALGGYYGGLLARGGADVHFLMRSDYRQAQQQGLRVDSKHGNFHLPKIQAYDRAEAMPPCDYTILALKTTQNHLLSTLLPPVVGDSGRVLVLQNGLCPEADVAALLGTERVYGGVCFLCSNKVGPAHIAHLDYGRIVIGQHRPAADPARGVPEDLQSLCDLLCSHGIDARCTPDQWLARWQKLMWNIPFNGLSVVLNAKSDALIENPHSGELAASLMREIRAAAAACGRQVAAETIDEMLNNTRRMVPYDSSMRLDYLAGRPMEVEAIFGETVRAAEAAGYESKQVRMLYEQLKFLEQTQSPSRPSTRPSN